MGLELGDALVGGTADAVVRDDRPVRQGIRQVALDTDVEGVTDERRGAAGHDRRGRRAAVTLDEQSGQGRHEEKRREEEGGAHRGGSDGRGANPAWWTPSTDSVDRFLDSPGFSESTRRAYASDLADFGGWLERTGRKLEDVDVQALAEYTAELGRGRRGLAHRRRSRGAWQP